MWLKKVIGRVKDEFLCCLHLKIKVIIVTNDLTTLKFMTRDELTDWYNNAHMQLTNTNLNESQLNWWAGNWNEEGQAIDPDCLPYDPRIGF
jgi:hypothetical protein